MSGASRGRRPGAPDTRAQVLQAARASFAHHGFARTTIRGIAADAGVDPALVHHYFGTKNDLFVTALQLPIDPRVVLEPVLERGAQGAGEGMLRTFLGQWEEPATRDAFLGLLRSTLEPGRETLLRDGFLPAVLFPVGRALDLDDPERRMTLIASQILGLGLCRYLYRVEPLASMDVEHLVAAYGPTLQRYLTGDLTGGRSRGEG